MSTLPSPPSLPRAADAYSAISSPGEIVTQIAAAIRTRSTPTRLRLAQIIAVGGALLLGVASWSAYTALYDAVKTVGRDTVPSIVAALHIQATLADANANAVNAFLTKESGDGVFWKTYRGEMNEAHENLVTAAQNITYGDEERTPIVTIMTALAEYEHRVGEARGRGQASTDGMLLADQLMHRTILPACGALDNANFSHLTAIYQAYLDRSLMTILPSGLVGVLLLTALCCTQWDLFRTTRRMINPGLALATFSLAVYIVYGLSTFSAARTQLIRAKKDAFDSVDALWRARAVGYDANAEQSLFLLLQGRPDAQNHLNAFTDKATRMMHGDPAEAQVGLRTGGYLGDELANITFDGEKDAAYKAAYAWQDYLKTNAKNRDLTQRLAAFKLFDHWLEVTLDINWREFNTSIKSASSRLAWFPPVMIAIMLLIAAASLAGIKPRLDEYRF